jgi:hypothetical protein
MEEGGFKHGGWKGGGEGGGSRREGKVRRKGSIYIVKTKKMEGGGRRRFYLYRENEKRAWGEWEGNN